MAVVTISIRIETITLYSDQCNTKYCTGRMNQIINFLECNILPKYIIVELRSYMDMDVYLATESLLELTVCETGK
jgi:hypothetical protein